MHFKRNSSLKRETVSCIKISYTTIFLKCHYSCRPVEALPHSSHWLGLSLWLCVYVYICSVLHTHWTNTSLQYPNRGISYVFRKFYATFLICCEQSYPALLYGIFITSSLCYFLITWSNKYLPSTVMAAFRPIQVRCQSLLII